MFPSLNFHLLFLCCACICESDVIAADSSCLLQSRVQPKQDSGQDKDDTGARNACMLKWSKSSEPLFNVVRPFRTLGSVNDTSTSRAQWIHFSPLTPMGGYQSNTTLLRMEHIEMQSGQPLLIGDSNTVLQVQQQARDWSRQEAYQVPDMGRSASGCNKVQGRNAVVLTNMYHPFAYYHFVIDTVFPTYVLVGHLAQDLDCRSNGIEVYYDGFNNTGFPEPQKDQSFFPAMEMALGKFKHVSEMTGCFQNVVYGLMWLRFLPCMDKAWYYKPRVASWWYAFAAHMRAKITPTSTSRKDHLLVIHHPRMPMWLQSFNWTTVSQHSSIPIMQTDLVGKSLLDQMRYVSGFRGIISLMGASFVNQLYLQEMSPILEIAIPQNLLSTQGTPGCGMTCDTSLITCHDMVGFHLGHSVMVWKWCESTEFHQDAAAKVLEHLLRKNNVAKQARVAWACHLCSAAQASDNNTECDVETVAPWPPLTHGASCSGTRTCGEWQVGPSLARESPFDSRNATSSPSLRACSLCGASDNLPTCSRKISWNASLDAA